MAARRINRAVPSLLAAATALVLCCDVGAVAAGLTSTAHRAGRPGAGIPTASSTAPLSPRAAVRDLLDRRAAAILHHDRAAFLATIDPAATRFRAAQLRVFANLAPVPLAGWSYQLTGTRQLPGTDRLRTRYGAAVYAPAGLLLHYQLAGFDAAPTATTVCLTFVQRGGHWLIASDSDFAARGHPTTPNLWDFGPVRVVRTPWALVLGHPQAGRLLADLAREVDADVSRVDQVWGGGWNQHIVVLVPNTQTEMGALIGDRNLGQIAAVTTSQLLPNEKAAAPAGERVVINPATFRLLAPVGRRVVLIHEMTHLAVRTATGPQMPDWLIEGFADYVGFRYANLTVPAAAQELRAEIRHGRLPAQLPADADFADTNPRLAAVFEEAWLACLFTATTYGQPALVRLYRADGAVTTGGEAAGVQRAMQSVLHTTVPLFTTAWRLFLVARLAR